MPNNVKIFFGLCLALVAYWVYSTISYLAFPSAHYLAMMAKLPPEFRQMTRYVDIRNMTVSTSVWCVIILLIGWLAAFRRQNWARWTLASLFVLALLLPVGVDAYLAIHYDTPIGTVVQNYVHYNWSRPTEYLVLAIEAAIIVFAFTGNARSWFRKKATL